MEAPPVRKKRPRHRRRLNKTDLETFNLPDVPDVELPSDTTEPDPLEILETIGDNLSENTPILSEAANNFPLVDDGKLKWRGSKTSVKSSDSSREDIVLDKENIFPGEQLVEVPRGVIIESSHDASVVSDVVLVPMETDDVEYDVNSENIKPEADEPDVSMDTHLIPTLPRDRFVPAIYPTLPQNGRGSSEAVRGEVSLYPNLNAFKELDDEGRVIPNAPPPTEDMIRDHGMMDLIDLDTELPPPPANSDIKPTPRKKSIRWQPSLSDTENNPAPTTKMASPSTYQWLASEDEDCATKSAMRTYQQSSGYTSDCENMDPAKYLLRCNAGYIVLELKTLCEIVLLEQITFSNCLRILQSANAYDSFILLSEALKVVAKHFSEIWKTSEFLNLNKHDLLRIFCHSKIRGRRDVVSALLRWYNHERDARTASYQLLLNDLQILEIEKENEIVLKPKKKLAKKDNYVVLFSPYMDDRITCHVLDMKNCEKPGAHLPKFPNMGADYAVCLSRFCCSDYFFTAGGHGREGGRKMWMYDIYHSKWKKCKSMQKDRTNHCMASISPRMYVIGGYQNGSLTANIDCFSMKSNRWKIAGKLAVPVVDASCIVRGGIIFIFGGVSKDGLGLPIVQSFNTETGESVKLQDLPTIAVKSKVALVKSRIFIAVETGPLIRFNPETYQSQIHVKSPFSRRNFAMVTIGDELYFIGGHNYESGPLKTVEKYCPSTDQWTYVGKLKSGILSVSSTCLHYRLS